MFRVVMIDGWYRAVIDKDGKPNKYGIPKDFNSLKDAKKWVKQHSYWGMSFRYEIVKEPTETANFPMEVKEKSRFVTAGGKLKKE